MGFLTLDVEVPYSACLHHSLGDIERLKDQDFGRSWFRCPINLCLTNPVYVLRCVFLLGKFHLSKH